MEPDDPDPLQADEPHLAGLGERFLDALGLIERGDVDGAAEVLRGILRVEPRLPEPRLELARILLDTGQAEDAEEEVREAISSLEAGGQWTDDLPESVVLGLAYDVLGESLRLQANSDEAVFGDPERFKELLILAGAAFRKATQLDPANEHAAHWAQRL